MHRSINVFLIHMQIYQYIRIYFAIDASNRLKGTIEHYMYKNPTHQQSPMNQDLKVTVLEEDEDQPVTIYSQNLAIEDVNEPKST